MENDEQEVSRFLDYRKAVISPASLGLIAHHANIVRDMKFMFTVDNDHYGTRAHLHFHKPFLDKATATSITLYHQRFLDEYFHAVIVKFEEKFARFTVNEQRLISTKDHILNQARRIIRGDLPYAAHMGDSAKIYLNTDIERFIQIEFYSMASKQEDGKYHLNLSSKTTGWSKNGVGTLGIDRKFDFFFPKGQSWTAT